MAGGGGEENRPGGRTRRIRGIDGTVVGVRSNHRLHAIRGAARLDSEVGRHLSPRYRRHLAVHGPPHHLHDAARRAEQLELHHRTRRALLFTVVGAHHGYARRVCRARHVPVLCALGSHAHPDVFPHRGMGWRAPDVRRHQVLRLHLPRLAAHARRHPGDVLRRGTRDGCLHVQLRASGRECTVRGPVGLLVVRGVCPRVRDQGPDVPVPHVAAGCPRRGAHAGLGAPGWDSLEDGYLRVLAIRPAVLPGSRAPPRGRGDRRPARGGWDHLRRAGGNGAAGFQEAHSLFVGESPRFRDARHLGPHVTERAGGHRHHDQSWHLHGRSLLHGRHDV